MTAKKDRRTSTYIECRDLRHAWRYSDVETDIAGRYHIETLVCLRCPVIKQRFIGFDGDFVKDPRYIYPDDYIVKGEGRLTAYELADIRLSALQKHMPSQSKSASRKKGK